MVFSAHPLLACKCVAGPSVCGAYAAADHVFIGRVESMEPDIDVYDPTFYEQLQGRFSKEELDNLDGTDIPPETLRKFKEFWAEVWPEPHRGLIMAASTEAQMSAALESAMDKGKKVRIRVSDVFRGAQQDTIEVWTDFSDCGIRFQKGETYLVYANLVGDRLTTGACSRTSRLSEAGSDLAYFYLLEHGGTASARLYGFVSGNERDMKTPRYWDRVSEPLANLTVELRSIDRARRSSTDAEGRFVFDGVEAGIYDLSVFDVDRPEDRERLAGTRRVSVRTGACSTEVFFVPKK